MKVIQINTVCGYGSTGNIVVDIAEEMKNFNVQTEIIYGQMKSSYDHGNNMSIWIENKIHAFLSRILGLQGFFSVFGTLRIIKFINVFNPDIIHIHNLHGNYVCYPLLLKYIKQKDIPVVFTLHDCWLYTGKCAHYADVNCEKWIQGCKDCPKVRAYPPSYLVDSSEKVYKIKKRLLTQMESGAIVGVSDWISSECKKSFLRNWKILRIYNWLDLDIFKPRTNQMCQKKYGIRDAAFMVLGVCGRWSKEKGLDDWQQLFSMLPEDIQIVLVGKVSEEIRLPSRCIHIQYTADKKELAELYSRANVFLNLSQAESFGMTTAEALACGTPVIVYNTTACTELVEQDCGYVVSCVQEVVDKIESIKSGECDIDFFKCRESAKEKFDPHKNIREYFNLYRTLIK